MTKIVYVGPYEEGVELVLPSGAAKLCKKGVEVDVPAETAESALEQDIWKRAAKAAPAPTQPSKEKE